MKGKTKHDRITPIILCIYSDTCHIKISFIYVFFRFDKTHLNWNASCVQRTDFNREHIRIFLIILSMTKLFVILPGIRTFLGNVTLTSTVVTRLVTSRLGAVGGNVSNSVQ